MKVLATGLAAGILLDATVIRALLVPAVVSLFGTLELVDAAPAREAPTRRPVGNVGATPGTVPTVAPTMAAWPLSSHPTSPRTWRGSRCCAASRSSSSAATG